MAKNAMMLAPHDTERLGLEQTVATDWAERGFGLIARENGDFLTDTTRFELDELRMFGGLLAYFAATTDEELHRITNSNPPDKTIYASRLYEGQIAHDMHGVIEARVQVPSLWAPRQTPSVGFRP